MRNSWDSSQFWESSQPYVNVCPDETQQRGFLDRTGSGFVDRPKHSGRQAKLKRQQAERNLWLQVFSGLERLVIWLRGMLLV